MAGVWAEDFPHLMKDRKQREGDSKKPGTKYPHEPVPTDPHEPVPSDLVSLARSYVLRFPTPLPTSQKKKKSQKLGMNKAFYFQTVTAKKGELILMHRESVI